MMDADEWGLLIGVIVGWAGLVLLLLGFLAGASGVRRSQGLQAARVVCEEHEALSAEPNRMQDAEPRGRTPLRSPAASRR
jgi:hypothetical protein